MKLKTSDYRILDQMALQIRIDYDFLDDDLDVFKLAKKLNITLMSYSQLNNKARKFIEENSDKIRDGFFTMKNKTYNSPTIFFNDDMLESRIKFTISHETGHYIIDDNTNGEYEEAKANHFARQLLIPNCLVMMYLLKEDVNVYDLQFKFGVSKEVAENALSQAKKGYLI